MDSQIIVAHLKMIYSCLHILGEIFEQGVPIRAG